MRRLANAVSQKPVCSKDCIEVPRRVRFEMSFPDLGAAANSFACGEAPGRVLLAVPPSARVVLAAPFRYFVAAFSMAFAVFSSQTSSDDASCISISVLDGVKIQLLGSAISGTSE